MSNACQTQLFSCFAGIRDMPLPQQPMQVKQCKCTKKSIVQVKKNFSLLILIFEIILVFGMTLFKCMIILIRERKGEKGKLTEFFCTW